MSKKFFVLIRLVVILTIVYFIIPKVSFAQQTVCCCSGVETENFARCTPTPEQGCSLMSKDKCAGKGGNTTTNTTPAPPVLLTDPLGIGGKGGKAAAGQEVQFLIGRVIKVIMGLVGSIALLMFVYGGFLWMTAAGNEEKVSKGKEIIIWAVAGLAVIFSSYILVYFVLASLMGLG